MAFLLGASLTDADASKRIRETDDTLGTPTKMRRVAAEPEEALSIIAAPLLAISPFEALPRELKVHIISFFGYEEAPNDTTLFKFAQVSKKCNAAMFEALPYCDLSKVILPHHLIPERLELLKRFRTISFGSKDPTDTIMDQIVQLNNIRQLHLGGGTFTPQRFTQLASLSAKLVDLEFFGAEPAGATADDYKASIGSLTRLADFQFLRNDQIREEGVATPDIANALSGLTSLTSLYWNHTRDFNDDCMRSFADATKLQCLYLVSTSVTNAIIPQLKALTNLKELYLDDTGVTQQGKADLRASLTNLETLN